MWWLTFTPLEPAPGCHRYELQVEQVARVWMGADRESFTVQATLQDGQWGDLSWEQTADSYGEGPMLTDPRADTPFEAPWLGQLDGRDGPEAWLDAREAASVTGWEQQSEALWSAELGDGRVAELQRVSGEGGAVMSLDVGRGGPEDDRRTHWTGRVDAQGLPVSEALVSSSGTGIWRMRYRRTITYTRLGSC